MIRDLSHRRDPMREMDERIQAAKEAEWKLWDTMSKEEKDLYPGLKPRSDRPLEDKFMKTFIVLALAIAGCLICSEAKAFRFGGRRGGVAVAVGPRGGVAVGVGGRGFGLDRVRGLNVAVGGIGTRFGGIGLGRGFAFNRGLIGVNPGFVGLGGIGFNRFGLGYGNGFAFRGVGLGYGGVGLGYGGVGLAGYGTGVGLAGYGVGAYAAPALLGAAPCAGASLSLPAQAGALMQSLESVTTTTTTHTVAGY